MPVTGLSNRERPPYVIFIRGTVNAFNALEHKDPNTLYYISDKNSSEGKLYLGNKLIAGEVNKQGATCLRELEDVLISTGISNDSILLYNDGVWKNKPLSELLFNFIGATETEDGIAGLVPPSTPEEREYFLRGDGTWTEVHSGTLEHSLTIGDKVFDGSEDVTIDVYNGEIQGDLTEENISTTQYNMLNTSPMSQIFNIETLQMNIVE